MCFEEDAGEVERDLEKHREYGEQLEFEFRDYIGSERGFHPFDAGFGVSREDAGGIIAGKMGC